MGKRVAVSVACFLIVAALLAILIGLQPSSQEAALSSLAAAEKVLGDLKPVQTPTQLLESRKALTDLSLPKEAESERDKAVAAIDQARRALGPDQARLDAWTAEIQTAIQHAKNNLSAPTAMERTRGIKDQILSLAWPAVIAILVIYFVTSGSASTFLEHLSSIVSNVKVPGGLEIGFAAKVKKTQEEVLRGYRQQVIEQYDAAAVQNQISETVDRIVSERVQPTLESQGLTSQFRCTIHVRDILFQDSLYQLIDYLLKPRAEGAQGGGKGRAWSVSYGLVGRCWRLEEGSYIGAVPTDKKQLIVEWGMTKPEAERYSGQQTLLCRLIRTKSQNPLGIFYLDALQAKAFGNDGQMEQLSADVDKGIRDFELDVALERVWQQMRTVAPLIEIYAKRK